MDDDFDNALIKNKFFADGKKSGIVLVLRLLPHELSSFGLNESDIEKIIKNLRYRLP